VRISDNSGKWNELWRPSAVLLMVVAASSSCGQRTTLVGHDAFADGFGNRVPKNHRPSAPVCAAERDSSGYERTVPWLELFQDHCQPKKGVPFETPWKMDSLYGWNAAW